MSVLTTANPGKQLRMHVGGEVYERFPVQTPTIAHGDDLLAVFEAEAGDFVQDGDIVLVAESVVSIAEGRAYKFDEIVYGWWAQFLSRFVSRTPAGIGLGTPQTMQLALDEAGYPRIILAAAVAAVTRPLGIRGMFYRIAGPKARGIDGPTEGTLPPYNQYASLIPKDPQAFVKKAEAAFATELQFIVIDANDIGVNILGARSKQEETLGEQLAADNPLGQGSESTPFLICRKV